MKGLDLAELYYREVGAPMIAERFGPWADRIAAGLVGPGSECLGFDDEQSRDHDWGPGFCLWLSDDDFEAIGGELQWWYAHLPDRWSGYGPRVASPGEEWRVGTTTTGRFFRRLIGCESAPAAARDWLRIPEHALAAACSGRVFHDPLGAFSSRRAMLIEHYPPDVRRARVASLCLTAGQAGQYNLGRALARDEGFAAAQAAIAFATDAMRLTFLLNRRYAPFAKWLHRGVALLPVLGAEIHACVATLVEPPLGHRAVAAAEDAAALLVRELRRQALSDAPSDFLLEHAFEVRDRIADPAVREWALARV